MYEILYKRDAQDSAHILYNCTCFYVILKENKTFQVTDGMSVRSGQKLQMCPLHITLYSKSKVLSMK